MLFKIRLENRQLLGQPEAATGRSFSEKLDPCRGAQQPSSILNPGF